MGELILIVIGCPLFLIAACIFIFGERTTTTDVKWGLLGVALFLVTYFPIAKQFIQK
tara:strand:- start:610 stop:780 length:171 start_codon:yes stop_codon:yes gene_type:complete